MWKSMTEEEKAPYQNETKLKLEKYRKAMDIYKKSTSYSKFQKLKREQPMKGKKGKWKKPKDVNKPKKPLSAYFRFIAQFRKENPKMSVTESTKAAAPMWKGLSDAQRKVYEDKANEEKRKYEVILAQYHKTPEYAEYQEKLKAFKKMKRKAAVDSSD